MKMRNFNEKSFKHEKCLLLITVNVVKLISLTHLFKCIKRVK